MSFRYSDKISRVRSQMFDCDYTAKLQLGLSLATSVYDRCEYTFEKNLPSDNRGFAKFVSHSELRHPQLNLLPGDTLTILCEISISGDNVVTSGTSKYVPPIVLISS